MEKPDLFDFIAFMVEVFYTLMLFLSPVFLAILLAALFFSHQDSIWSIPVVSLLVLGCIGGVLLNVYVWKKERPSTFFGRLIGRSDD
ncbi:MAG: hypothetical protein EP332_11115 [Bacteroidetes bacterium]|nr:MAG: hypothetical protein EP332_11115 [Bacteroidota bacterium]